MVGSENNKVMSAFNINAGYGAKYFNGVPLKGGKVHMVSKDATNHIDMLKELFTPDAEGVVRFHATIDAAMSHAENGDVVLVAPTHTESVIAAGGLDLDVAGVTILGLGNGASRPTITLSTATTADIDIDAANITIENLIIDLTGVDALVAGIDVNSSNFTMRNCQVLVSDSDGQAIVGVLTDTAVDYMTIENCRFIGDTSKGPQAFVRLIGGTGHEIVGNIMYGNVDTASGLIQMVTTAPKNVSIRNNFINNFAADTTASCILGITAATGEVSNNRFRLNVDAASLWVDTPGSLSLFENYGVNDNGETGMLVGTASAS